MTLSLDDVRNMRFRMARKSGYEVLEVDEFVDQVEETIAQLIEENQNLKRQVSSLKSAPFSAATPNAPATSTAPSVQASPQQTPERSAAEPIVVTTSKEASTAVVRLVEMSTDQAERLMVEADEEANQIKEEANRAAHQVTTDARTRAERVESEARVGAERMQADALNRAEQLDREIESRRNEMLSGLEKQQDHLTSAVTDLRNFEAAFRSNMANHLKSQMEAVQSGKAEPVDVPEILKSTDQSNDGQANNSAPRSPDDGAQNSTERSVDRDDAPTLGGGSSSDTPRLDALLGDQR